MFEVSLKNGKMKMKVEVITQNWNKEKVVVFKFLIVFRPEPNMDLNTKM